MKFITSILLSLAILCTQVVYAQIEVKSVSKETVIGTVKNGGRVRSEMSYTISNNDTLYTILYQDAKYQYATDLDRIVFTSSFNNLENFYIILKSFFSKENKKNKDYKLDVTLGDNKLHLTNYTVMGITAVTITSEDGSFMLTEKQLDKLFGK